MLQSPLSGRKIPVVDMGQLGLGRETEPSQEAWQRVAQELHQAFADIGFAYLINHGVPDDQLNRVFELSAELFSLEQETKNRFSRGADDDHGYVAVDREKLDPELRYHELREAYNVKNVDGRFPDEEVPCLRPAVASLIDSCMVLTNRLLTVLALSLGLARDFFTSTHREICTGDNMSILRLLHYPPVPGDVPENTIRCGAHTDYGTFTLLFQDLLGGLQVRERGGAWIDATPIPGAVVVNVGDLLQFWTADQYLATEHRVVVPRDEVLLRSPRRSVVFFVHPDDQVSIRPLNGSSTYAPITAAAHTIQRFKATYNYQ
nr:UPF0676 protein C1494.01-like [Procambarus clarkii]